MTKIKLALKQAQTLTAKIIDALAPGCQRIEPAGSVRRCRPEVGDLEIVCIPRPTLDLFGNPTGSLLDLILADLVIAKRLIRGDKNGDKYKNFYIPAFTGLKLDLFITTPECWGVNFTIRTGSAEFSHKLVTPKWQGGFLPGDLRVAGARVWRGDEVVPTNEELDLFELLELDWIEPKDRY
jgi:DNA polymerase/3'-5' exonuclease PolX